MHLEIAAYPNVDLVASSERLPFRAGAFDAAACESVLEHVSDPWRVAAELHRVLRPAGVIRVDAPFLAPFHAYPHHFHNFTQSGLEQLLSRFTRLDGGIGPHQEPWLAIGWILRVAREGLPDDSLRREFDGTTLGALLAGVATGKRATRHPSAGRSGAPHDRARLLVPGPEGLTREPRDRCGESARPARRQVRNRPAPDQERPSPRADRPRPGRSAQPDAQRRAGAPGGPLPA